MKLSVIIALSIVSTVLLAGLAAASGVLIAAQTKQAGYNDAAYYAYTAGDKAAAEHLYLLAIKEDPSYRLARYNLATLYFQESRYDDAIGQLETLVQQDPSNAAYHYDLAVNLVENIRQNGKGLDQFDRALSEYKEADALSPGFSHVTENIAVLERIKAEYNIA